MLTERTLRKWRKEALKIKLYTKMSGDESTNLIEANRVEELCIQVLRLTQILLDQHLMKGK